MENPTFNHHNVLRRVLAPLAALTLFAACSGGDTAPQNEAITVDIPPVDVDYGCIPEGNEIMFSSNRDGDFDIYRTHNGELIQLTENSTFTQEIDGEQVVIPIDDLNPQYSDPRNEVVFYSNHSNNKNRYDVVFMNATTTEANDFTNITANPEGTSINDPTYTYDGEATLMKIDNDIHKVTTTSRENLTGSAMPNHEEWKPAAAANGIFFTVRTIEGEPSSDEIYFRSNDGEIRQITDNQVADWYTEVVAETGEVLFISQRNGGLDQIFIMNSDGKNKRALTNAAMLNGGEGADPSPAGQDCVLFISSDPNGLGDYDIATFDRATNEYTLLTTISSSGRELSPIIVPVTVG